MVSYTCVHFGRTVIYAHIQCIRKRKCCASLGMLLWLGLYTLSTLETKYSARAVFAVLRSRKATNSVSEEMFATAGQWSFVFWLSKHASEPDVHLHYLELPNLVMALVLGMVLGGFHQMRFAISRTISTATGIGIWQMVHPVHIACGNRATHHK
jgi:hypothetical protein